MAITIEQAVADKTGATARAYAAQNKANRATATPAPITIEQATSDRTGATARAFAAQNIANRTNTTPSTTTGTVLNSTNLKPSTPMNVVQPAPATGSAILASDIIAKGQADTARALAEEQRIATQQGQTGTAQKIAEYLKTSTPQATTTQPQGTQGITGDATSPINVNGITAETLAAQRQGIQDALSNQMGQAGLTSAIYAQSVDPATKELNEINARINEESLAGRRREEAVLTLPGITKAQAQDKINEIRRGNASTLADLSVVQMAKQGQYDSAREIADRAIQAKLEEQKNRNDALLFTYQENKELFTKAEQRQFEQAQRDRERKLDAEEKVLTQISNLALDALQNGAPTSVVTKMQKAKTVAEATLFGGQYVGRLDRQVKESQIRENNAQAAKAAAEQKLAQNPAGYTQKQLTYITGINEAVSKNDTYKKTNNAKTFTNNVLTALSQETGTGDLAAINQFQKVIDEGAVTRDQDVKLIQGAQSLADSIKTKFKKLGSGQQLSPALRDQMKKTVQDMYLGQVNALKQDPYVASKLAEVKLFGVDANDTILGEITSIPADNKPTEQATNPYQTVVNTLVEKVKSQQYYNPNQGYIIPNK